MAEPKLGAKVYQREQHGMRGSADTLSPINLPANVSITNAKLPQTYQSAKIAIADCRRTR